MKKDITNNMISISGKVGHGMALEFNSDKSAMLHYTGQDLQSKCGSPVVCCGEQVHGSLEVAVWVDKKVKNLAFIGKGVKYKFGAQVIGEY